MEPNSLMRELSVTAEHLAKLSAPTVLQQPSSFSKPTSVMLAPHPFNKMLRESSPKNIATLLSLTNLFLIQYSKIASRKSTGNKCTGGCNELAIANAIACKQRSTSDGMRAIITQTYSPISYDSFCAVGIVWYQIFFRHVFRFLFMMNWLWEIELSTVLLVLVVCIVLHRLLWHRKRLVNPSSKYSTYHVMHIFHKM